MIAGEPAKENGVGPRCSVIGTRELTRRSTLEEPLP
jgi:hypothetical protein